MNLMFKLLATPKEPLSNLFSRISVKLDALSKTLPETGNISARRLLNYKEVFQEIKKELMNRIDELEGLWKTEPALKSMMAQLKTDHGKMQRFLLKSWGDCLTFKAFLMMVEREFMGLDFQRIQESERGTFGKPRVEGSQVFMSDTHVTKLKNLDFGVLSINEYYAYKTLGLPIKAFKIGAGVDTEFGIQIPLHTDSKTMHEVIKSNKQLPFDVTIFLKQMTQQLLNLQSKGFAQTDMSAHNILICEGSNKDEPEYILIDFENMVIIGTQEAPGKLAFNPHYCAPEISQHFLGEDVAAPDALARQAWELGVLAYLSLTGKYPVKPVRYTSETEALFHKTVLKGVNNIDFSEIEQKHPGLAPLVKGLLTVNPSQRWTLEHVQSCLALLA